MSFWQFYEGTFLEEHRHPLTVGAHVLGTLAGLAFVTAVVSLGAWYLALLFPVVHGVPGLVGHRWVERNAEVGDLRATRTDFPIRWFILANHLMTLELVTGRLGGRRARAARLARPWATCLEEPKRGSSVARAEDGRAHAHVGGALFDGDLEVGAHAHGEPRARIEVTSAKGPKS